MRNTKPAILEAVHETARGFEATGVMDQITLREFDRLCLPPIGPLQPFEIRRIRENTRVSQALFAALLNTSFSTIQKWEIGQKRPPGISLRQAAALDAKARHRGRGLRHHDTAPLMHRVENMRPGGTGNDLGVRDPGALARCHQRQVTPQA